MTYREQSRDVPLSSAPVDLHVVTMSTRSRRRRKSTKPADHLVVILFALAAALPSRAYAQIEVHEASIMELQAALADGSVTSAELVEG